MRARATALGAGSAAGVRAQPKPREPTKHQYDYDSQTVHGFLLAHKLEADFKVQIDAREPPPTPTRARAHPCRQPRSLEPAHAQAHALARKHTHLPTHTHARAHAQVNVEPNHTTLAGHSFEHDCIVGELRRPFMKRKPAGRTPRIRSSAPRNVPHRTASFGASIERAGGGAAPG